ncbi:MAG: hypothetical protein ACREOO_14100 [bacterium]
MTNSQAGQTVGDARDTVCHLALAKVDQKAEALVCQAQIGLNLFFLRRITISRKAYAEITQRFSW